MDRGLLWKPFDSKFIANPYPMYKNLREQEPIHKAQTQEFILTRYQDIRQVLKDNKFRSGNRMEWLKQGIQYLKNKDEDLSAIYQAINSFILMLNDVQHQKVRSFVSKAWTDKEVDAIINQNISRTLSDVSNSSFDLVTDYSQPIPVLTICNILGIPTEEHKYLKELGLKMTKALDLYVSYRDLLIMNDTAQRFVHFFKELLKKKEQQADQGLLSKLVEINKHNNTLNNEEMISVAIFLFIAGQETSSSLISNALYLLLKHPDERDKIQDDPTLTESAIEEVLRYDSTVQLLGRIASENSVIDGVDIPANSTLTLAIGAGNRDPAFFENPDSFVITRKPNRHLSFGSGQHYCMGDWLARKLALLSVTAFLEAFPNATLVNQTVQYQNNLAIRAITSCVVSTS